MLFCYFNSMTSHFLHTSENRSSSTRVCSWFTNKQNFAHILRQYFHLMNIYENMVKSIYVLNLHRVRLQQAMLTEKWPFQCFGEINTEADSGGDAWSTSSPSPLLFFLQSFVVLFFCNHFEELQTVQFINKYM